MDAGNGAGDAGVGDKEAKNGDAGNGDGLQGMGLPVQEIGMQGIGIQGMQGNGGGNVGDGGAGNEDREAGDRDSHNSSGTRVSCLGEGFVLGVGAKRKKPLNCSLRSSCHPSRRRPRVQNKALHLQINKNKRGARMQEYFTINLHKTWAVPNVPAAPEPLLVSEQVLGMVGDVPQIPPGQGGSGNGGSLPNHISAPKEAPQVGGSWLSSSESQNFSTVQNVLP